MYKVGAKRVEIAAKLSHPKTTVYTVLKGLRVVDQWKVKI